MKSNAKKVIARINKRFEKIKREAPRAMAQEGVKVFLENFKSESWNNNPWQRRKPTKKPNTKPILIGKTRRLRNSVVNSVRKATPSQIVWASSIPYAAVHNDGGKITRLAHYRTATRTRIIRGNAGFKNGKFTKGRGVKMKFQGVRHLAGGSQFNMPRRRFMGKSVKLYKRIRMKYEQVVRANFK